jgi:hypothetical protein
MTTPLIAVIDRSLRCPLEVIDVSRRCPSGARQSPGGEADPVLERSPLRRLPLVKASGTCVDDDSVDCRIVRRLRCPLGVIDVSLPCPSGARQSPGGGANGDCGTGCVSLRTDHGGHPASGRSKAHIQRSAVSAPRRLTGTRGFRRLMQATPTVANSKSKTTIPTRGSARRRDRLNHGSARRRDRLNHGSARRRDRSNHVARRHDPDLDAVDRAGVWRVH